MLKSHGSQGCNNALLFIPKLWPLKDFVYVCVAEEECFFSSLTLLCWKYFAQVLDNLINSPLRIQIGCTTVLKHKRSGQTVSGDRGSSSSRKSYNKLRRGGRRHQGKEKTNRTLIEEIYIHLETTIHFLLLRVARTRSSCSSASVRKLADSSC